METCIKRPDEFKFKKITCQKDIEEIIPRIHNVKELDDFFIVNYEYRDMSAQCTIDIGRIVVVNTVTLHFEIYNEEDFNRLYEAKNEVPPITTYCVGTTSFA